MDPLYQFLYSNGPMVQLLVSSNISRYLEFITCAKLTLFSEGEGDSLEATEVPCSRSSIFNDRRLSVIQKRSLMKFIGYCMDLEKNQSDMSGEIKCR